MEWVFLTCAVVLLATALLVLAWHCTHSLPKPAPETRHVLMCDLSSIPVDATIVEVTLRFNYDGVAPNPDLRPRLIVEYSTNKWDHQWMQSDLEE